MERAERRVRAAMRELAALPGSQAKRDLEEIARYITRRNC
jgi:geranylgeranyl pyrophosphate synthase